MPELPDITTYIDALTRLLSGRPIEGVRLVSPSLLKTVDPPLSAAQGKNVLRFSRIGKRIVWHLEDDLFLVFHLMIVGRYHWKKRGAAVNFKTGHLALDFLHGTLLLTEAGSKKRASLHVVRGESALRAFEASGVEPLDVDHKAFTSAFVRENHTLKRALTDPTIVSGVGNAYSDEILHRAKLSPVLLTQRLTDDQFRRLHDATRTVLTEWIERLRRETGDRFPEKVTAFRDGMAVHGRFGQPCPVCGSPVQRIVRAENESNYCPTCQTGGKLLADRALSRLLKEDWPATLEELERHRRERA